MDSSIHRNKENVNAYSPGSPAGKIDGHRPPERFSQLLKKHGPIILEDAAAAKKPVNTVEMTVKPIAKKDTLVSRRASRRKSRYYDGDRLTLWGKIRMAWRATYRGLGIRHWAFVFILVAYAFLGGAIFSFLERRHLNRTQEDDVSELAQERRNLTIQILSVTNATNETAFELESLLEEYQRQKDLFPKRQINWDIWDGVFYSFTVFTTIGYGHFVPVTRSGRVATMLYALIGIPLVLAVLADFGKLMTRSLKNAYSGLRHMLVHIWRWGQYKRMKARGEDVCIGVDEPQEDVAQFDFPIPLAVLMVVAWLFACCSIYHLWETDWSYFETFYFFFISLSTIGLGDLTPAHPKYMLASFPFILVGLTLISLVINLIQDKIDQLREKAQGLLEDQFGLDTVSASEYDEEGGDETGPPAVQLDIPTVIVPQPSPSHGMKPRLDKVALGVLQTVQLRPKRRRIGTQTAESYVRDVLHAGQFIQPVPSVLSSPSQLTAATPSPGLPASNREQEEQEKEKEKDELSVSSNTLSYFTVSSQQISHDVS